MIWLRFDGAICIEDNVYTFVFEHQLNLAILLKYYRVNQACTEQKMK